MTRIWIVTTALLGSLLMPAAVLPSKAEGSVTAVSTVDPAPFPESLAADQQLLSVILSVSLLSSDAQDAENAGAVENLVVGADGSVAAVVVNTRNYLGDKARTIAVPTNRFQWTEADDERRVVLTAPREELVQAPSFSVGNGARSADLSGTEEPTTVQPSDDAAPSGPAGNVMAGPPGAAPEMAASTTDPATPDAPGSETVEGEYLTTLGPEQYLTRTILGSEARLEAGADGAVAGRVSDLVVSADGRLYAVVIGMGGVLGVGRREVAVPFEKVTFVPGPGEVPVVTLALPDEELSGAPTFRGVHVDVAPATATSTLPSPR